MPVNEITDRSFEPQKGEGFIPLIGHKRVFRRAAERMAVVPKAVCFRLMAADGMAMVLKIQRSYRQALSMQLVQSGSSYSNV